MVYGSNIVKGLRLASRGEWPTADEKVLYESPMYDAEGTGVGREDSLRVLSASHTILALILMGVLVLQAGQWYAERKERQEMDEMSARREEQRGRGRSEGTRAGTGGGVGGEGKGEGREGKKKQ